MASRYHRQMLLPGIGDEGQQRLRRAHILIIGCGALGCPAADLLVRAGIGTITLVDRDIVELTNLQRQSLYDQRDVAEGLPKAEAARRRLSAVNSEVNIRAIVADFTSDNAEHIASGHAIGDHPASTPADLIIDGTDNFEARYLMNDLAVKRRIPYAYGGAVGTRGMQMTVPAGGQPCLRCLFEELPAPGSSPTCDTAGVLAPVATIVASCQAADAIRIIARQEAIPPTLLDFNPWPVDGGGGGQRRRLDAAPLARPDCPCCAKRNFEFLAGGTRAQEAATALCGRSSVQVTPAGAHPAGARIDIAALAARLAPHGAFEANRFLLRGKFNDERTENDQPVSLTVFPDGRALVHGTTDAARARAIYARYIGA